MFTIDTNILSSCTNGADKRRNAQSGITSMSTRSIVCVVLRLIISSYLKEYTIVASSYFAYIVDDALSCVSYVGCYVSNEDCGLFLVFTVVTVFDSD